MSTRLPLPDQMLRRPAEYAALCTNPSPPPAETARGASNDPPTPAIPTFPPTAARAEPVYSAADRAAADELWKMVLGELTGFDWSPQARAVPIRAKFIHPDGKPDIAQHRRFAELQLALEDGDAPFDGRAVTLQEIEKFLTDRDHGRKVNGRTVISDPELAALLRAAGYEKIGKRDRYGTPLWAQVALSQYAATPNPGAT